MPLALGWLSHAAAQKTHVPWVVIAFGPPILNDVIDADGAALSTAPPYASASVSGVNPPILKTFFKSPSSYPRAARLGWGHASRVVPQASEIIQHEDEDTNYVSPCH